MKSQQEIQQGMRNGPNQSSQDQSQSDKNEGERHILEESKSEISKERELANQINKFRFKNQKIIQKLLSLIGGGEGEENKLQKSIVLPDMQKELKFQSEEIAQKFRNYIHEIDIVNQIHSDFTFNYQQNKEFIDLYKQQIIQNKVLFDQNGDHTRQQLSAQSHQSYYFNDISLKNYDELIILLLIEEFKILNSQSRQNDNLILDFSHSPQHLGLIDNLYNKLFIYIHDKSISDQIEIGNQGNGQIQKIQNSNSDQNNLYDIFILLIYDNNININQELNNPLIMNTNFKNSFLSQTAVQQQQNQEQSGTKQSNRYNQSLFPQKYKNLIKRSTQIPKQSILTLVDIMDSNSDRRVTVEDIKNFSHKKFIYLKDNIYQEMFDDVVKLRRTVTVNQKNQPLTVDEIWAADNLNHIIYYKKNIVQMHYKLNQSHEWIENPRAYRKYWIQLLSAAGERLPIQHDLPPLKVQEIKDLHQMSKAKKSMGKSQSCMTITNIPNKQFIKPFRAEAGIVVNNTEYIQEVVQDYKEQMSRYRDPEPFEKVVNLKFRHSDNGECQSIKFETKNYFNEAERLSKNPHLYKTQPKNPIYTFVPENFNFQISQKNENTLPALQQNESQGQDIYQFDKRSKQSLKFSKAQSPIFGNQYNYENASQLKEFDDMEEYDAESLMKTHSLRYSSLRLPSKNPQLASSQLYKSSLPSLQYQKHHSKKGNYPYDVFDPSFFTRKKYIKQIVTPLEKNLEKNNFITAIKVGDCSSLKQTLAKSEPITDIYNPVSQVQFREQHTPEKKQPYITRFKCEPLVNPYGVSMHDNRPKEALEREQREKRKKQEEEQKNIDDFMGKSSQKKLFLKYFKLADIDHNFIDKQRPIILDKGSYQNPSTILSNLLRGESDHTIPFKLAHRTLRAVDKNLFLGEVPDSKF